jgi:hypothetical protein
MGVAARVGRLGFQVDGPVINCKVIECMNDEIVATGGYVISIQV